MAHSKNITSLCFINLWFITEKQQIRIIHRFLWLLYDISIFELLFATHSKWKRSNFLEISLFCKEKIYRIIRNFFLNLSFNNIRSIDNHTLSWLTVFFGNSGKLSNDYILNLGFAFEDCFKLSNIFLKTFNFICAFENIFSIEMTKFDFSDIFSLNFINSETNHKIWNNITFFFGFTNYFNSLVNIKENLLKSLKKMELVLFFVQIVVGSAFYTLNSECNPFVK